MWLALLGLFFSGFTSATILPGNSEVAFVAYLWKFPDLWLYAFITVTIANSAGGMTSFLIARFIPQKQMTGKAVNLINKFGAPLVFFSFVPIIGDALPLTAGWLRLPFIRCLIFISLGKLVRYGFIVSGWWLIKFG